MAIMDAVKTVSECLDNGVVLTVLSDGKLSIKGNRTSPVVDTLKGMVQADRQSVLTAIKTVKMQRAAMAGWGADKLVQPQAAPVATSAPDPHTDVRTALIIQDAQPFDFDVEPGLVNTVLPDGQPFPPIRNTPGKPSLPADLWVNDLATFAEATQVQRRLCSEYTTSLGHDSQTGLFYVRCPRWQWVDANLSAMPVQSKGRQNA